eukprot:scaffold332_cov308-Pavlova_lutheri.AAC.10
MRVFRFVSASHVWIAFMSAVRVRRTPLFSASKRSCSMSLMRGSISFPPLSPAGPAAIERCGRSSAFEPRRKRNRMDEHVGELALPSLPLNTGLMGRRGNVPGGSKRGGGS